METKKARVDRGEGIVLVGLALLGVAKLILHPRKTYNLVVHNVGWYD